MFFLRWARGATDNASDYGSENSSFESWQALTHFCAVQSLDLAFLAVIEKVQQIESVVIERQQKQEKDIGGKGKPCMLALMIK